MPSFRTALAVAAISLVHAVVIVILSTYFVIAHQNYLQAWANFLGVFATVLSSIQYLPQIYTTYLLKRVGSLSIPMMCIQTPGSVVFAASLAARLGTEGWSAWSVYLVTGFLQGTLLILAVYYELRESQRPKAQVDEADPQTADSDAVDTSSEQTPLLRSAD